MAKRRVRTIRRTKTIKPIDTIKSIKSKTNIWLFTHPAHLEWWYSGNIEKYPGQKTKITGIINGYYELGSKKNGVPQDSEQHHNKWKDFAESMGWDYIPCIRFSHAKGLKYRKWLFDPKVHEAVVKKANDWGSIALDMEPYGLGWPGYHRQPEGIELDSAAKVWKECKVPVHIYPSLRTAPEIILSNCSQKVVLDHTMYNPNKFTDLKQAIADRQSYFVTTRSLGEFWTGLYLAYLNDKTLIKDLGKLTTNLWFFPRAKDDRRNFFTPNWNPIK